MSAPVTAEHLDGIRAPIALGEIAAADKNVGIIGKRIAKRCQIGGVVGRHRRGCQRRAEPSCGGNPSLPCDMMWIASHPAWTKAYRLVHEPFSFASTTTTLKLSPGL